MSSFSILGMSQEDFRNWIILILAIIGAIITIQTYIKSLEQSKLENTFKTLDFLRRHITENEKLKFIQLFHANNELSGVKFNEFRFEYGQTDTIETMFSEGGCGNGEIHNMIELFSLICPTLETLEIDIIWYEYGQIMSKIYHWTKYLEDEVDETFNQANKKSFYSDFNAFMDKHYEKMLAKPIKHYTYLE